ncbi:type I restriction endonuclease subunit R [Mycoplasma suis]|uniref:Type I restriction enzyme endonuclease subunit n=1 Tax=Mycoplasma suis (strain Illinois) TaxID=768700 RepID=F0QS73_MYCSL|nr:HsdR family type I site-specific deoxyribonuclease [Mycoplasma suis]ADX98343.1 type I site-specific deoxyribonuclease, HsdR family protein [Mycoplasma suis str. Illinois]
MSESFFNKEEIKEQSIEKLKELGWEIKNFSELRWEDSRNPILISELKLALKKINSGIREEQIQEVQKKLQESIKIKHFSLKNHEKKYKLIKNGFSYDGESQENIKIIDFENPENNLFTVVPDFEISSSNEEYFWEKYKPDLVCFVNGLPLIFFSIGESNHTPLKEIYLENYKKIFFEKTPQLFLFNAFSVITNGKESKIGAVGNRFEFFHDWHRLDENCEGKRNILTLLKGICNKKNLLDFFENFTIFQKEEDDEGERAEEKIVKIIARNHQFLGVNKAFESFLKREENEGKIGTFWHTQGSGKSFSILFFAEKIIRKSEKGKIPLFLIITDRKDLERQIFRTFKSCGVLDGGVDGHVISNDMKLNSYEIKRAKKYLFCLVHKFNRNKATSEIDTGGKEVVIIADEAHRTQYGDMASLMYKSFPKSSRIGFTGTPLLVENEKTARYFGNYVSKYDFGKAMDDGVTIPIVFESRGCQIEENKNFQNVSDISGASEEKIPKEWINNESNLRILKKRLKNNARDFVDYFSKRFIYKDPTIKDPIIRKGMYICSYKETCILMHNFVSHYWQEKIKTLEEKKSTLTKKREIDRIEKIIFEMKRTEMKVVISNWGDIDLDELKNLYGQQIEIPWNREGERGVEERFKDRDDPFRVVFVVAMWLTGFDVKPLTFLFIDKVLRDHTLMQAIARVNRVDKGKPKGFIVDYVGCIQHLKDSLKKYGGDFSGERIIKEKKEIFEKIKLKIEELEKSLRRISISIQEHLEKVKREGEVKTREFLKEFKEKICESIGKKRFNLEYSKIEEEISGICEYELPLDVFDKWLVIKKIYKKINEGSFLEGEDSSLPKIFGAQKHLDGKIDFKDNERHFQLEVHDFAEHIKKDSIEENDEDNTKLERREFNNSNYSSPKSTNAFPNEQQNNVDVFEKFSNLITKLNEGFEKPEGFEVRRQDDDLEEENQWVEWNEEQLEKDEDEETKIVFDEKNKEISKSLEGGRKVNKEIEVNYVEKSSRKKIIFQKKRKLVKK